MAKCSNHCVHYFLGGKLSNTERGEVVVKDLVTRGNTLNSKHIMTSLTYNNYCRSFYKKQQQQQLTNKLELI